MIVQLRMELLALLRSPWHGVSMISSALTLVLLLVFGLSDESLRTAALPAMTLGVLFITLTHLVHSAFLEDATCGRIAHWRYGTRCTLGGVVVAKWLAYLLAAGLPLSAVFSGVILLLEGAGNHEDWVRLPAVMLLCSAGAIACALPAAGVSACFGSGQLVAQLLCLPLLFSMMIFGVEAIPTDRDSSDALSYLSALGLMLTPLCCAVTARILRYTV